MISMKFALIRTNLWFFRGRIGKTIGQNIVCSLERTVRLVLLLKVRYGQCNLSKESYLERVHSVPVHARTYT